MVSSPEFRVFIKFILVHGSTWKPGKVLSHHGQMMYNVELPNGQVTHRHIGDICIKTDHIEPSISEDKIDNALPDIKDPEKPRTRDAEDHGPIGTQVEFTNPLKVLCS